MKQQAQLWVELVASANQYAFGGVKVVAPLAEH